MFSSEHNKYNRKQKKRVMHLYKTNHHMQNPKTESFWDKVFLDAVKQILTYLINFTCILIILLLYSKYYNFELNNKELLDYILEVFAKIK